MWDFMTAGVQIIRSKDVGIVCIALADKTSIEFEGIALVLEYKSNFISLGQLQDNKIYHDQDTHMLLTQDSLPIVQARRDWTLFVLDITISGMIMITTGQEKHTH